MVNFNIKWSLLSEKIFTIKLADVSKTKILALGADIKGSLCLIEGSTAKIITGFGNLSNPQNFRHYHNTVKGIFNDHIDLCVCDLHPTYLSSQTAYDFSCKRLALQHHFAHIASCIAENDLQCHSIIGIAADGTGYGTDGAIWGCEIIKYQPSDKMQRIGHLRYFDLFGGDICAIENWRPAAGVLNECYGGDFELDNVDEVSLETAKRYLNSRKNIVQTSSLGRLFDAVAFMLGLCNENQIEAQAAFALENAANNATAADIYEYDINYNQDGLMQLDYELLIRNILIHKNNKSNINNIAMAFHKTIAKMLVMAALNAAKKHDITRAVLSGGCFYNKILSKAVHDELEKNGIQVFKHNLMPSGDECIAFGQAMSATESFGLYK